MRKSTFAGRCFLAALFVLSGNGRPWSAEQAQPAAKPADANPPPGPANAVPGPATPTPPTLRPGQMPLPGVGAAANPFLPTTNLAPGRLNVPGTPRTFGAAGTPGLTGATDPAALYGGPLGAVPPNPFKAQPRGGGPGTTFRQAATFGMRPPAAQAAVPVKPFATFRPQTPVSPYMGLFAPRTSGVDNYNAYVRPQLQQQAFNQQAENRFRTLQTTNDQQGNALKQLEQEAELFQTEGAPSNATFMELGPYYPMRQHGLPGTATPPR
jgi:hypothetical protein